jgi:hypothetical protein
MKLTGKQLIALAAVMAAGFGIGLFTHFDWYPALGTYGVSVGTDNAYCSSESVNWLPEFSCQDGTQGYHPGDDVKLGA